jgi:hypothetical protein
MDLRRFHRFMRLDATRTGESFRPIPGAVHPPIWAGQPCAAPSWAPASRVGRCADTPIPGTEISEKAGRGGDMAPHPDPPPQRPLATTCFQPGRDRWGEGAAGRVVCPIRRRPRWRDRGRMDAGLGFRLPRSSARLAGIRRPSQACRPGPERIRNRHGVVAAGPAPAAAVSGSVSPPRRAQVPPLRRVGPSIRGFRGVTPDRWLAAALAEQAPPQALLLMTRSAPHGAVPERASNVEMGLGDVPGGVVRGRPRVWGHPGRWRTGPPPGDGYGHREVGVSRRSLWGTSTGGWAGPDCDPGDVPGAPGGHVPAGRG